MLKKVDSAELHAALLAVLLLPNY